MVEVTTMEVVAAAQAVVVAVVQVAAAVEEVAKFISGCCASYATLDGYEHCQHLPVCRITPKQTPIIGSYMHASVRVNSAQGLS